MSSNLNKYKIARSYFK